MQKYGHEHRSGLKILVNSEESITIKEASERLGISPPACQAMYGKGMSTMVEMIKYRKDLEDGFYKNGGNTPVKYETSKGTLTLKECVELHEHGLVKTSIKNRGMHWGFDHLALWLPKGPGFKKAAEALDGPARGDGTACGVPGEEKVKKSTRKKLNRLKACLRDNGREKCIHYAARIHDQLPTPKECSVAAGDICTSYSGASIKVLFDSSGRPPRRFSKNGTSTTAR